MKKVSYIELDYGELEDLIKKTYGHSYEFVAQEELMNDMSKTYSVKKEVLEQWDQEDLDGFITSGRIKNWRTHTILTDLANKGIIEEGDYLINISW